MRLPLILIAALCVVAVTAVNVALLRSAGPRNDPVGRLSPLLRVAPPTTTTPAPAASHDRGVEGGRDD